MSDKKNIDRLFQERLKDLDVTPNPEVWGAIEAKLKAQQKQKRVIPIWWRASGVAALLLLFLALGNFVFNTKSPSNTPGIIVDTPIVSPSNTESTIVSNTDDDKIDSETRNTTETQSVESHKKTGSTQIANQSKKETPSKTQGTQPTYTTNTSTIASNTNSKGIPSEEKTTNNIIAEQVATDKIEQSTASHPIINDSEVINKTSQIASNENTTPSETLTSGSIMDTLSIEAAIAATKVTPKVDPKSNKWDIHPNIAPVYYSSIGNGSHIDDQFANNTKSGEINTSYGVGVGYAINNKLKIRSGVNNLKLSFNTNDVLLFENTGGNSRSSPQLQHIATTAQSQNLTLISANKAVEIENSSLLRTSENSAINQNISYFEVPLELEYVLLNKRFGINLIGGFSTFI
ncbi:hypothetical protein [Formosa haliotis]|uniref:hypothetical protein n=1 Tax=Formosa haliotis TaxID=1555194 RepID=UPI000826F1A1|nr:hypothetical protein [Formosa haliotis]